MTMPDDVKLFHETYGQPAPEFPQMLPVERHGLRTKLIRSEFQELSDGLLENDPVEVIDGAIDILYVTFGLLVEMGLDAQPFWDEVQASNMSKLGEDGLPILSRGEDLDGEPLGKVIKGPNYFKPDIRKLALEQGLGAHPTHELEKLPINGDGVKGVECKKCQRCTCHNERDILLPPCPADDPSLYLHS
jgi:predicted HAD superfamily Cof-like phosphohydrolase